jgi:hypothetical protein
MPNSARDKDGLALATPTNFALLQKSPSGDFIATVKMTLPDTRGMRAGLYYWVDDDNFVFIGPWTLRPQFDYDYPLQSTVRRLTLSKRLGDSKDETLLEVDKLGNRDLKGESPNPETWYLQLERAGVKYIGRVSVDGKKWEEVGTQVLIPKSGRLGLGAYQDWKNGNEQPVEFEEFVVKDVK